MDTVLARSIGRSSGPYTRQSLGSCLNEDRTHGTTLPITSDRLDLLSHCPFIPRTLLG